MTSHTKPRLASLALIGLVSGVALVEEIQLPFSPAVDSLLLALGILLFYAALALWIKSNRQSLERSTQPRDCVGRPIFDPDSDILEPKQDRPVIRPAARSFHRSEMMSHD